MALVSSSRPRLGPTLGGWRSSLLVAASWVAVLAFLAWAIRLAVLEGYIYEIDRDFLGDFTRTAELGAPTWFTGQGLFYGPIFVLEYRLLLAPGIMSGEDFSRLDFLLFVIAFACTWAAVF